MLTDLPAASGGAVETEGAPRPHRRPVGRKLGGVTAVTGLKIGPWRLIFHKEKTQPSKPRMRRPSQASHRVSLIEPRHNLNAFVTSDPGACSI